MRGPIVGHFYIPDQKIEAVRVYAPAAVSIIEPNHMAFLPLMFVGEVITLFTYAMLGMNEPTDKVLEGYEGYVDNFVTGAYEMVANDAVDSQIAPDDEGNDDPREACPGCEREVSDWQDHYPVFVPRTRVWTCEKLVMDIREMYPDYEPPHPSSIKE